MHIYIYAYIYIFMYMCIYVYVYIHIHIHIYTYTYTYIYKHVCIYMYIQTYIYIHINRYIYIYNYICPPDPMNTCRIIEEPAPPMCPLGAVVPNWYKTFPPDQYDQAEIQDSTMLSNTKSTILRWAAEFMHICTERWVNMFSKDLTTSQEAPIFDWIGSGRHTHVSIYIYI